jgi:hypothetical protein
MLKILTSIVILLSAGMLLDISTAVAGPAFPTRGFLIAPKWDTAALGTIVPKPGRTAADTTSVFDHAGYWAQVQRGFGSDSDRWGWSVTMGGIFEFARWSGNKSLFGFTGMELTANTHNDISFKPRGATWEEGLMYAVHENSNFDWQIGSIYRCRHDLDNIDPAGYSDINQQRTIIYCSLSGKAIWSSPQLFGMNMPTTAWLHADAYLVREDYRIPESDNDSGTNFKNIAWSFGPSFHSELAEWGRNNLYLTVFTNLTSFGRDTGFTNRFASISKLTFDDHLELGYEFHGRVGRIQFYAGWEQWQDDGQTPIPRDSKYAILGIRVTGVDMVRF